MREFDTWFGDYLRIDLETMFRTDDRIAQVATDFVLRNPAQIRKTVRPMRKADRPAVHLGLPEQKGPSVLIEALDRIAEDAGRHDGTASVLLLGRYRHLRPRNLGRLAQRYPGLRFAYRTVHRSKGMEADYAVVLGPVFRQTRLPLRDHGRPHCSTWYWRRPKRTRMPKSGACSTSPLPGHDARSTCWLKAGRRHRSPTNCWTDDTT